jgi:protein transport protein SEC20
MTTSKQLITALEKSDWLDRLLILSGLAFFLLVVLFILKQRIIDRGVRVALWWTRFLPTSSWGTAKAVVGAGRTSVSLSVTSAVVTSTSTLLPSLTVALTLSSSGIRKPPVVDDSTLSPTLDVIASTTEHLIELPSSISTYSSITSTDTDTSDPRTSDNVDMHDEL